jgi:flagellin-like protein
MRQLIREKRAISPVIATVILVAVAITVAVAVAYWMSGIAGMYTKFEKVEIQSAYAPKVVVGSEDVWNITLVLKNTGSANSTLINAFVNDKPITSYSSPITFWYSTDGKTYHEVPSTGVTIGSGQSLYVILTVKCDLFSSGTTLNVKLHSAGGMDYIKLVELT